MMTDIAKVLKAVEMLRKRVHKGMPSQHLSMLLAVAEQPGITMPELCRVLDMPQGTVSRNVKVLSCYVDQDSGNSRPKGRNLLRTQTDQDNPLCLAVYLTGRGEAVVEELLSILYPEREEGRPTAAYSRYRNYASGASLRH